MLEEIACKLGLCEKWPGTGRLVVGCYTVED